eukprot:170462-Ditylum_brightwellii.AAC.1
MDTLAHRKHRHYGKEAMPIEGKQLPNAEAKELEELALCLHPSSIQHAPSAPFHSMKLRRRINKLRGLTCIGLK